MKKNLCYSAMLFLIVAQTSLAGAIELEGIDIHGFVSQGFLQSSDNNYLANTEDGSFEFTEMAINFSKEFKKLRIGAQIASRDLGEFGNNDIILDWAMGDYRHNDALGLRIGKIKMPVGLYNQGRDIDMLRTPILLPSSVYDEGAREFNNAYQGGGLYGIIDGRALGEFDYELYYGTIDVDEDSSYARSQEKKIADMVAGSDVSDFSISTKYVAGGALRWSPPLEGLRLGLSYRKGKFDASASIDNIPSPPYPPVGSVDFSTDVTNDENWVASIEYTWNDLILVGEFTQNKREMDSTITAFGINSHRVEKTEGWYLQATYRFTDWLAAGVYYSEFYPERDDKDGDEQEAAGNPDYYAWQKEIVPTLRFDIGSNWVIKAETHFVNGAAQVYDFNNPEGREKNWILYALKATFSF